MPKQSGKLSKNTFTTKLNGESKSYRVEEKSSIRTREVSENYLENYQHTTRIAYNENGTKVGIVKSGRTGQSFVLDTNNY